MSTSSTKAATSPTARRASSSSIPISITNGRPSPRTELSVWNLSRSVMATSTGKLPVLPTATVTTTHSLTGRGGMALMRERMVLAWLSSPSEMKTRMTRSHGLEARFSAKAFRPAMISVHLWSILMEAKRPPVSALSEKAMQWASSLPSSITPSRRVPRMEDMLPMDEEKSVTKTTRILGWFAL